MASDYYSDGEDGPAPETAQRPGDEAGGDETGGDQKDRGEAKTALINSEVAPGLEPGDEIVLKVRAVHEGEYLVEHVPEPEEEREPGGEDGHGPPRGGPEGTGRAPMPAMGGMYE